MRAILRTLVTALLGGAVVAVVLLATGVGRETRTTTVIQQAPLSAQPASQPSRSSGGLTARDIYKRDAPGVVQVSASIVRKVQSPFDLFPQEERGQATGSGFLVDPSGDILTNAHVIDGAASVSVQFEDGVTRAARVVGKDTSTDLALLKVDLNGLNVKPLELADSRTVQVGDPVIAIGNPFGLDRTLTTGVVSALQREISAPNGFAIQNVIQTDAAINPGNSGGPLLDAAGRVIGINSQIATGGGGQGNVGIGFAVPIDTAKQVIPQLEKNGRVERGYLGVETIDIDASLRGLDLKATSGALVQSVVRGSPADRAGLRGGSSPVQVGGQQVLLGGDAIQAVDGTPIRSGEDLRQVIASKKPGDKVTIRFLRDGREQTVTVTLDSQPASAMG
jgi:S1-C subfamily serine protease